MRFRVVTLKAGSWFGDYQILLLKRSNWDVEAGGDHEYKSDKKPLGMPHNHIMVYKLDATLFLEILKDYPEYRKYIVTRSLVRRMHFIKSYEDNKQVVLLRLKQEEHAKIAKMKGIKNDYLDSE